MGIVNLEAMAAGKAVLATKVGGVPELISNEVTGLLVPPHDVPSMAEGLQRLMLEAELRDFLASAGLIHVESFDWRCIANDYATVYESVL